MVNIGSNLVGNLSSISNTFVDKLSSSSANGESDFKSVLSDAIDKFEKVGDENAQSTFELLTGNTDDLSSTMIASQKAELAVNLTVAVRNKAIEAYKEIMNMQV